MSPRTILKIIFAPIFPVWVIFKLGSLLIAIPIGIGITDEWPTIKEWKEFGSWLFRWSIDFD